MKLIFASDIDNILIYEENNIKYKRCTEVKNNPLPLGNTNKYIYFDFFFLIHGCKFFFHFYVSCSIIPGFNYYFKLFLKVYSMHVISI